MHTNFYFLRHLSKEIAQNLNVKFFEKDQLLFNPQSKEVFRLLACFSQSKDELILGFGSKDKDFYIKAVLNADFACLSFPADFQRAKKNSVDLFKELIDLPLISITQYNNERSFSIEFEKGYQLLFKMHGRRSNIILFQNNEFVISFHKKMENDRQLVPSAIHRYLKQDLEQYIASEGNLTALFPTFGKEINEYVQEHILGLRDLAAEWGIIAPLVDQLLVPKEFKIIRKNNIPEISILDEKEAEIIFKSNSAIETINEFYYQHTKVSVLDKEKGVVLRELQKQKKQAEGYISKNYSKLAEFESSAKNEETAHLIMANLHLIPEKAEKVELFDFYTNQNRVIKLKKDLSPQKNAESYYKKAKNEKVETDKIQQNIAYKEKELLKLDKFIHDISQFQEIKPLRTYLKNHKLSKEKQKQENLKDQLFKKFEFQGYEILIGKNAKNNDLLLQHSYKDDLWLHAKDVTGSHVIIKQQSGKVIPKEVIEKAASLAAYYSKRSNDSLCPVIVTPRKFVRKTKDLADGQVIVEKEEIILVIPESFN